jgi:hypothetical protein
MGARRIRPSLAFLSRHAGAAVKMVLHVETTRNRGMTLLNHHHE